MAADSGLLEEKRRVEYRDLAARSYLSRCPNPQLPFQWTINPYRGCEYGCRYCYARYTHEFMELRGGEPFETRIFAKQWNPALFRKELLSLPHGETVAIGTATDPYQPAERRYRITRRMLEVIAGVGGLRVWITTKSDQIRQDIGLLKEIGRRSVVHVNVTVTTVDSELAGLIEPYAPRPERRLEAVRLLREAGVAAGVSLSPVLPLINDSEASIDAVCAGAKDSGALWLWHNILFLRSCAREVFFPFLEREFPLLVRRYRERYGRSDFLSGAYPEWIGERVTAAKKKYGLADDWSREQRRLSEELPAPQLRLGLGSGLDGGG